MVEQQKSQVIAIALITAASILGDAMLFIVLPLYWQEFGLVALWQVGVLLSVNRFIRLPITPIVGWAYQRMSKRSGILIAVILAGLSTFSYGILGNFWLLVIARACWGVAWSFLRIGGFLTILEVSTAENRGRLMGTYNGLWGLGGLTGMLAGGLLTELIGVTFVTSLFAIMTFSAIPFVLCFIPATKESSNKESKKDIAVKSIWKNSQAWSVLLTGVVVGLVIMGVFLSTMSPLVEFHLEGEFVLFGLVIGAATISGLIQALKWAWDPFLAPLAGRLSDELFGRQAMLGFSFIASAGLFLLFTKDMSFSFIFIVIIFFQLMATAFMTVSDSLAGDVASTTSSVGLMTAYTVAIDVGAAMGPLLGFLVLDQFGLPVLYQVIAVILLMMGIFWVVQWKKSSSR